MNVMKKTETAVEPVHSASSVMKWISNELSRIAAQIENFPIVDGHAYTLDEINALQAIDTSRQTLMDLHQAVLAIAPLTEGMKISENELCSRVVLENTIQHIEELG